MSRTSSRTGVERAAILLLTLGESEAAEILKHMGAKDVQRLGKTMSELTNVSKEEVRTVLSEFTAAVEMPDFAGRRIRRIHAQGAGQRAGRRKGRQPHGTHQPGRRSARVWTRSSGWTRAPSPSSSATNIRRSSPSCCRTSRPTRPPKCWRSSRRRIRVRSHHAGRHARRRAAFGAARTRRDDGEAVRRRGWHRQEQHRSVASRPPRKCSTCSTPRWATSIMADIAKADERLSQNIQDLMFVFADLMKVDDRGMQELLRQVPADKLLIALKGADEEFKTKVFKNMSQRAAEMLKSDLEAKGPVKLSRRRRRAEGNPDGGAQARRRGHHQPRRQGRRRICLRSPSRAGICPRSKAPRCRGPAPGASTSCISASWNARPGSTDSRTATSKACARAKRNSPSASTK